MYTFDTTQINLQNAVGNTFNFMECPPGQVLKINVLHGQKYDDPLTAHTGDLPPYAI